MKSSKPAVSSAPPPLEIDFDDDTPAATPTVDLELGSNGTHPSDAEWTPPAEAHVNGFNGSSPHSTEAEESLLSSCLLDGGDVIPRCIDARIRPESFYEKPNRIIFDLLLSLHARKKSTDLAVVFEELKSARQLKEVGGLPFLTRITAKVPTTAEAGYFIEKVREQAILREAIRAAERTIDEAKNFSGGIDEFLSDQQARLKRLSDGAQEGAATEIMVRAFDAAKLIPRPDRIYSIAGVTVCTPGNLTTIYSQAKTGKSSFEAAMMAATMTRPTNGHDTLGVEGPNYAKHAVVHFDTEQSPYDWQQLVRSSLRRVGLEVAPPWLMSFTIAGLEAGKAEKFVHAALRLAKKLHGGIHSVFIDGVADLVNDPNSPDECFPLIARLQAAAIEYNTAIVNILHLNPAAKDKSDKGRGHLGSQLERKCESNLTLKKEGEITVVAAEGRQRGKSIPSGKGPAFKWSEEHQMHRSCPHPDEADDSPKPKGGRPTKYQFSDYAQIFPGKGNPPLPKQQLWKLARELKGIPESSFRDLLSSAVEDGMLERFKHPTYGFTYALYV